MQHFINRIGSTRRSCTAALALTATIIAVTTVLAQVEVDITRVQGVGTCAECHGEEVEAWKKTTHAKTERTMHKHEKAQPIIDAMGLGGRIKTNDLCYQCHYTMQMRDGVRKVDSGVSCESCHGAGRDWTGDALHHKNAEDAEATAKEELYQKCEQAGMLRPANVYKVAKNCFSCHTVPNEKLVNVGGHPAGSKTFDLVAWSQGEVRHNYQHSDGKGNRSASPERLRVLYVVGAMTDLEYGLRGLAKAKSKGTYVGAMVSRVNRALAKLDKIAAAASIPEVTATLAAVERRDDGKRVKVTLATAGSMAGVAATVSAATEKFSRSNDGAELGAIDGLLPKKTMGTAQP